MKKTIIMFMALGMLFGQVDYESEIQTIFNNNCTSCHVNGGAYQNGLDLSSYENLMAGESDNGPVVIPLDHANSLLWQKVNSGAMPPGNNPDLSGDEVNLSSLVGLMKVPWKHLMMQQSYFLVNTQKVQATTNTLKYIMGPALLWF